MNDRMTDEKLQTDFYVFTRVLSFKTCKLALPLVDLTVQAQMHELDSGIHFRSHFISYHLICSLQTLRLYDTSVHYLPSNL